MQQNVHKVNVVKLPVSPLCSSQYRPGEMLFSLHQVLFSREANSTSCLHFCSQEWLLFRSVFTLPKWSWLLLAFTCFNSKYQVANWWPRGMFRILYAFQWNSAMFGDNRKDVILSFHIISLSWNLDVRVKPWLVAAFYKQSHCFSLIPRKNTKKTCKFQQVPPEIPHRACREKRGEKNTSYSAAELEKVHCRGSCIPALTFKGSCGSNLSTLCSKDGSLPPVTPSYDG